ncbi:MAG TPA: hypothetical protein VF600_04765 [Abditibacteriaceae bacterium]|jgi:hypothetical protein
MESRHKEDEYCQLLKPGLPRIRGEVAMLNNGSAASQAIKAIKMIRFMLMKARLNHTATSTAQEK